MFCGECGTKNAKDSAFCSECGAKFETANEKKKEETIKKVIKEEAVKVETKKEKVKPAKIESKEIVKEEVKETKTNSNPKNRYKLKVILVIMVALIAGYYGLNYYYSPDKVANELMQELEKGEYAKLYSVLDIKTTTYTTEEKFNLAAKDFFGSLNGADVEIEEIKINDSDAEITYSIEDKEENEYEMLIVLDKETEYFVKPKWVINVDESFEIVSGEYESGIGESNFDINDYKVSDIAIQVPVGSELLIDGKTVSDKYISSEDDDTEDLYDYDEVYDIYIIPSMYQVEYLISISNDYNLKLEGNKFTPSYTYEMYDATDIDTTSLAQEQQDEIIEKSFEIINHFYTSAFKSETFESIKDDYNIDGVQIEEIEEAYNDFVDDVNGSYTTLKTIEFSENEISYIEFSQDNSIKISLRANMDYTYIDYFDDSGSNSGTAYYTISLKYVDDELILYDITSLQSYYSKN